MYNSSEHDKQNVNSHVKEKRSIQGWDMSIPHILAFLTTTQSISIALISHNYTNNNVTKVFHISVEERNN
jgi:hypothetical protein